MTYLVSILIPTLIERKSVFNELIDSIHKQIKQGKYEKKVEMINKSNGRTSVPQIFFGDKHIGGCDDLFELEEKDELNNLLKI